MADKLFYMSPEGLAKLHEELHELKTVRRKELAERIGAAKDLGDLSENAEYHEAKEALGYVEGRIQDIQHMLKNIVVMEEGKTGGAIRVGTTVTVELKGKERVYKIVGSNEADPVNGLISNESPLGNAFLGHVEGATVEVETPAGINSYKVISVR